MAKLIRQTTSERTVFAGDPARAETVTVVTALWDDDSVTYTFREPDTEFNRSLGVVGDLPLWAPAEPLDLDPTREVIEKLINDYAEQLAQSVARPAHDNVASRLEAEGWLIDHALGQLWDLAQTWAETEPQLAADGIPPTCCALGCCAACSALEWYAEHDRAHAAAAMAATGQKPPGEPWGLKLADGTIDWAAVTAFWDCTARLDCAHGRSVTEQG